jgi:hypothetical protein
MVTLIFSPTFNPPKWKITGLHETRDELGGAPIET